MTCASSRQRWLFGWICLLAVAVRVYFWNYGYGQNGTHGLLLHGDGYWDMARSLADHFPAIPEHWRALQIAYPLYLLPPALWKTDPSLYVFCLHQFFVVSTCFFIYRAGQMIAGNTAGLLAAFVFSLHLQIAFWFNFTLADTCFHFHLSLFAWITLRLLTAPSWKMWLCWGLAGVALAMTRPEGIAVYSAAALALGYREARRRHRTAVFLVSLSLLGLAGITWVIGSLERSPAFRTKILSHIHVAWALDYGSQPTPMTAPEVDRLLNQMYAEGADLAAHDPQGRNMWFWISQKGWARIHADPGAYLCVLAARVPNVLFPSFYREGVSFKYKIVDRGIGFFLLSGILFAFFWRKQSRGPFGLLVGLSGFIYLCVTLIQSEWDVRVQLSAHILLLPVAAAGWVWGWDRFVGRNRTVKKVFHLG